MRHHVDLAARFVPRRFDGGMTLFVATGGRPVETARSAPGRWDSHVQGPLRVHEVAAAHEFLMHPEPQARIGRLLEVELQATARLTQLKGQR
jgi:hypothetical protein